MAAQQRRIVVKDITGETFVGDWIELSEDDLEPVRELARNLGNLGHFAVEKDWPSAHWWQSFNPQHIVSIRIDTYKSEASQ